jgi:hypothetical protein
MNKPEARKAVTKIIWSCSNCGTVLPLWQMKCSNCHRLALSWLHLIVALLILGPTIFVLVRLI